MDAEAVGEIERCRASFKANPGPRFLSVGLIIIFLFRHNWCRADIWRGFRLDNRQSSCFLRAFWRSALRAFSNSVMFFSIIEEAGWLLLCHDPQICVISSQEQHWLCLKMWIYNTWFKISAQVHELYKTSIKLSQIFGSKLPCILMKSLYGKFKH